MCRIQTTGKEPVKKKSKNSLQLNSILCPIFADFLSSSQMLSHVKCDIDNFDQTLFLTS